MGLSVKVGDPIPLSLQLRDGNESQVVQATVLTPTAKVVSEVLLAHQRGGLYMSAAVAMPDVPFVVAQYKVLNTDFYEDAADEFQRDVAEAQAKQVVAALTPKATKWIVGQVYAGVEHAGFILGRVTGEGTS
jgi:hypothetical protein